MKLAKKILQAAAFAAASISLTSGLLAQTSPAVTSTTRVEEKTIELPSFVVTGRAGTEVRSKLESSYSITTRSEEELRLSAPMGVAESLRDIPGFWVEASGGEASANVRARGIPTDGYSTVNLLEDGLPIQHDPALGWLNADQSFRMDQTIKTLEVVRGGPSAVFTSNAPGGSVNYITRKGDTGTEGILRFEGGDFDHRRFDFYTGGAMGDWYAGVGGFHRSSNGVRDAGFKFNSGGQIRISLGRKLTQGSVDFSLKRIDDSVGFYLGTPFTFDASGDVKAVNGFDGKYGTLTGPELTRFSLPSANGKFDFDNTIGTELKLTQLTLKVNLDLGGGWKLENGARYRDSTSVRNGFFPAALSTGSAFLSANLAALKALYPTVTTAQLRYVTTPSEVFNPSTQNGNGLVLSASMRSVSVPESEFLNDARVVKKFQFGGQSHDVALGFYVASIDESFTRYSAQNVTDVRANARLMNYVGLDAAGNVVGSLTENGFSRYGNEWANGSGSQTSTAIYLSDEWTLAPGLRLDAGLRHEKAEVSTTTEGTKTVNLGISTTPVDDNVLTGNGLFTPANPTYSKTMWSAGINYQLNKNSGIFARTTVANKIPSISDFITNPTNTPRVPTMRMHEAGYKYSTKLADLYATGFYTGYDSYGFSELAYNASTNDYVSRSSFTSTKTYGVELEGALRPLTWFELKGTATLQRARFGDFKYISGVTNGVTTTTNFSGNQLLRVPETSFRLTPCVNLEPLRLHLELPVEYFSDRYSDAANLQKLPAYSVLHFRARASLTRNLTAYLIVDNLTNTLGLTEGNPRSGQFISGDVGATYYIARSILGRSGRIALQYQF
jgi:outer membrane receptor protein involved in Fe transport